MLKYIVKCQIGKGSNNIATSSNIATVIVIVIIIIILSSTISTSRGGISSKRSITVIYKVFLFF